jgi:WD40 repeat protein
MIVCLWDVESGKEICKFEGHSDTVYSVCFSSDSKNIVSGSSDNTVRVWDVESGKEIRKLEGHSGSVYSACFSPNGKSIVSGSEDTTVRVWDVENGKEIHKLEGHSGRVKSVCFSPNGKSIVSGSEDTTVRVWNVENGKEVHKLEGHSLYLVSVRFCPDGKYIVVAEGLTNIVKYWNTETFTKEAYPPSPQSLGEILLVNQPIILDNTSRILLRKDSVSCVVPPGSKEWVCTLGPTGDIQFICGIRDVRVCIWMVL